LTDRLTISSLGEVEVGSGEFLLDGWRPGYSFVFFLAGKLASTILINKLLIFPLILIFSLYAFYIGDELVGPKMGFAVAVSLILFSLSSPSSVSVAAGLPRSFMAPAILAVTYYLMKKQPWKANTALLLGGTIYLPVAVLGGAMVGLYSLRRGRGSWPISVDLQAIISLIVSITILILIIPPIRARLFDSVSRVDDSIFLINAMDEEHLELTGDTGATTDDIGELTNDSGYEAGSRLTFFKLAPFIGHGGLATKPFVMWSITLLTMLAASSIILLSPRRVKSHRLLIILILASMICFAAAWIAYLLTSAFLIYFPSRYTRVSIGLALMIFVVVNTPSTVKESIRIFRHKSPLSIALFMTMVVAISLAGKALIAKHGLGLYVGITDGFQEWLLSIGFALFVGSIIARWIGRVRPDVRDGSINRKVVLGYVAIAAIGLPMIAHYGGYSYKRVDPNQLALFRFLESLPKDAIIGGDLCTLSSVPLMVKRQVIQSCEHLSSSLDDAALENLRAYYAETIQHVEEFCTSEGVDYSVVQPNDYRRFRSGEKPFIFEPYNSIVLQEIGSRNYFALEKIPEAIVVYQDSTYVVMRCQGRS